MNLERLKCSLRTWNLEGFDEQGFRGCSHTPVSKPSGVSARADRRWIFRWHGPSNLSLFLNGHRIKAKPQWVNALISDHFESLTAAWTSGLCDPPPLILSAAYRFMIRGQSARRYYRPASVSTKIRVLTNEFLLYAIYLSWDGVGPRMRRFSRGWR